MAMAIAYVWIKEGLYDKEYVKTHTVGFDVWKAYLLGDEDGIPKTPEWQEKETGVPARDVRALGHVKLCAIGAGTSDRFSRFGIKVDLIPQESRAESVIQALLEAGSVSGVRFLLPRALFDDYSVWITSSMFAIGLGQACRQIGRTVLSLDLLVATVALHHNAELASFDADFEAIASVSALRLNRLNRPV